MGMFTGMGDTAPSQGKGTFLTDGEFKLEVQRVKLINSERVKKTFFVVESKVVTSTSPRHPKGQLTTWLVKMGGDWPEYALSDIKSFTMAASGAPDEEVDEAFMEEVVDGDGDLLAGNHVICAVNTITTKAGGEFAKHSFSPVLISDEVTVSAEA